MTKLYDVVGYTAHASTWCAEHIPEPFTAEDAEDEFAEILPIFVGDVSDEWQPRCEACDCPIGWEDEPAEEDATPE